MYQLMCHHQHSQATCLEKMRRQGPAMLFTVVALPLHTGAPIGNQRLQTELLLRRSQLLKASESEIPEIVFNFDSDGARDLEATIVLLPYLRLMLLL